MEKPLKTVWVSPKCWVSPSEGRSSDDHQGGPNSVSQVDEVSDMAPVCHLCGTVWGGLKKKYPQWFLPTLPSGRKLHPRSHPAAGHFSSSLYVSGAWLQLLPPSWSSEGVSLSQLLINHLWRTARKSRGFCRLRPQSPLVFTTRSYGNYFSWHWNPGLGAWCGTGTFHSWGNLPDFYPPYMGVKPAHSTYPPLLPVKI